MAFFPLAGCRGTVHIHEGCSWGLLGLRSWAHGRDLDLGMNSRRAGWLLLIIATVLNLRLFVRRWADPLATPLPPLVSKEVFAALVVGVSAAVVGVAVWRAARRGSLVLAVLMSCAVAGWCWILHRVPVFAPFFGPQLGGLLVGAAAGLVGTSGEGEESPGPVRCPWAAFALYSTAAFNFLLLFGPKSVHLPSYVQHNPLFPYPFVLTQFYYGSVHSDISPVSMALRDAVNLFFSPRSINATALSSMIYVSLGIGLAGLSVQMVFGALWGWMLLLLALTDGWVLAAGVSSALLGQPILSVAMVLFLCSWSLSRTPRPISWREAALLGAANTVGIVYSLYSYSAARMTWMAGSALAAVILVARRAVALDAPSARKVALCVLPAVVTVASIWWFLFGGDTQRFVGQLIISPSAAQQIKDVNSWTEKLFPMHDADVPIWWGTARPAVVNVTLYWKRTPGEVWEKLLWIFDRIRDEFVPLPALVFLGVLGPIVAFGSARPRVRWFALVTLALSVAAYGTYVIAQDYGAYRRGLAANFVLECGVVLLFAAYSHGGKRRAVALGMCAAFALMKAPSEINNVTGKGAEIFGRSCPICQPHLEIRDLVNDPAFRSHATRRIRIITDESAVSMFFKRCMELAVDTEEFHRLAPQASLLPLGGRNFSQLFAEAPAGEILVLWCTASGSPGQDGTTDADIRAVCGGSPPFGRLLGLAPATRTPGQPWWALIEK